MSRCSLGNIRLQINPGLLIDHHVSVVDNREERVKSSKLMAKTRAKEKVTGSSLKRLVPGDMNEFRGEAGRGYEWGWKWERDRRPGR